MLEYECDCICHSDSTKKHCDELSCTPCCTTCKHCNKKIKLGKMVKHLLKDHGIVTPKQEIEAARNKVLEAPKNSKNVVDIMPHESDRFSMVSPATVTSRVNSAYNRAVDCICGTGPEGATHILIAYETAQTVAEEIVSLLEASENEKDTEKIIEGIKGWCRK